jgi:hypothetical protein
VVVHRDTTRRPPRTEEGAVDGIGEREEQETSIRAKRRPPDSREDVEVGEEDAATVG